MNYPRHIVTFAILTLLLLVILFTISMITGVSQQYIEVVHSLEEYTEALQEGENILRVELAIDGLFIASYWLLGIFLVLALWKEGQKFLLAFSVACISITALLDVIENSTFLMFMDSLRSGLEIGESSVQRLVTTSTVKWNFAYFAFLFLGFAFPVTTPIERAAAFLMKYILLPIGLLVHTLPGSTWLLAAHLSRFAVLIGILALLSIMARKWIGNVARLS